MRTRKAELIEQAYLASDVGFVRQLKQTIAGDQLPSALLPNHTATETEADNLTKNLKKIEKDFIHS